LTNPPVEFGLAKSVAKMAQLTEQLSDVGLW
jgi:hypothetical protein